MYLQFGCDEAQIMRQGTMDLWALTWGGNKKPKIVAMEAAGLLIGGASREIAHRVKTQFGRVQAAVLLVRARLGEDADRLCAMANGGVQLLKTLSAMHGTCNCANKVVSELKAFHGAEGWAAVHEPKRPMADYLRGNHARGLTVAAFERDFEAHLKGTLGTKLEAAVAASGGRAHL
jgi:hypothetical protein